MAYPIDRTGQRFGALTAQYIGGHNPVRWLCVCDCGALTLVQANNLTSGNTTTCGHCNDGDTCMVEGCSRPRYYERRMCSTHAMRMHRYGGLEGPPLRKEHPSYRAVHARLVTDKGHARSYSCVDCGSRAAHWSYDGLDTYDSISPQGYRYSVNQEHYEPRCVRCHNSYDRLENVGALLLP